MLDEEDWRMLINQKREERKDRTGMWRVYAALGYAVTLGAVSDPYLFGPWSPAGFALAIGLCWIMALSLIHQEGKIE